MKHAGGNKCYQARQSREIFLQIEMLYHLKSLTRKGYGNRKKHLSPLAERTHKLFDKWVGKKAFFSYLGCLLGRGVKAEVFSKLTAGAVKGSFCRHCCLF